MLNIAIISPNVPLLLMSLVIYREPTNDLNERVDEESEKVFFDVVASI
jgi:hypothetical protein